MIVINSTQKQKAFISIFAIFFGAIVVSILTALYILLIKQIEILNMDSTSFQAFYMTDSAFECVLYKEQNSSSTKSVFLTANSGSLGKCISTGDAVWKSQPTTTAGRSKSELNISMTSQAGNFCGIITTDKETRDTSSFTTAPTPNYMTISGQGRSCTDSTSTRVVERLIEFYY